EVLRFGQQSEDPLVRLRVAREAPELAQIDDPFAPVRELALRANPTQPNLERALLDSSAAIRSFARKRLPADRVLAIYRSTRTVPAIVGLAETGDASDAIDLLFLLDHRNSHVRDAVATAIGKLAGDEAIDPLLTLLDDKSRRVVRKAQQLLTGRVNAQRLWE